MFLPEIQKPCKNAGEPEMSTVIFLIRSSGYICEHILRRCENHGRKPYMYDRPDFRGSVVVLIKNSILEFLDLLIDFAHNIM